MDRNILGVLKPTIQGDLHFSETDFGNVIFAFSIAYAAGYAAMARSQTRSACASAWRWPQ
jgi:MFS transporter, ACS family, hexuronate transporter